MQVQQTTNTPPSRKMTLFDHLLHFLFEIKLSIKLTLVFQFILIALFSVTSLGLGIYLFVQTPNVSFSYYDYGETTDCIANLGTNVPCAVTLEIKQRLEGPVNVYYQLENFISNSKDYINSKSNAQLFGETVKLGTKQANKCVNYATNQQMGVNTSWAGVPLDPNAIASPCGLQARLFFRDQIQIYKDGNLIALSPAQSTRQFTRAQSSQSTQWIDPTRSDFQIWMTTSVKKTVTKLYGIINQPLQMGNYTLNIKNNMNYSYLQTKKSIQFTKVNNDFGNNKLLGLLFIGGGISLLLICIIRFIYDITNIKKNV